MSKPHRRYECVHGTVVRQCRCIGPHEVVIVACPAHCRHRNGND